MTFDVEENRPLLIGLGNEFGEKDNRYTETAFKFLCNNALCEKVGKYLDNYPLTLKWNVPEEGNNFLNVVAFDKANQTINHLIVVLRTAPAGKNSEYYSRGSVIDVFVGNAFLKYQLGKVLNKCISESLIIQ